MRRRVMAFFVLVMMAMGMFAASAPSELPPNVGVIAVEFDCLSDEILVTSEKRISNIVYRVGNDYTRLAPIKAERTEDGLYVFAFEVPDVDVVWVKAGNNASGDGPGYGEAFFRPPCE